MPRTRGIAHLSSASITGTAANVARADRSNGVPTQIRQPSASSFAVAYRLTPPKVRTKPWPDAPIFDRDHAMMPVALRPGISDRGIAAIGRRLRRDGVFGNHLAED